VSTSYDYGQSPEYGVVSGSTFPPERAVAVVAGAALILLFLIKRGFRGVNVGGVGVSVR
jgi:uncharacterized membrane protein